VLDVVVVGGGGVGVLAVVAVAAVVGVVSVGGGLDAGLAAPQPARMSAAAIAIRRRRVIMVDTGWRGAGTPWTTLGWASTTPGLGDRDPRYR
jgi:hypothetical protein